VNIPELPGPEFYSLVLDTSIKVFGDHTLGFKESGITLPQPIMDVSAINKYPASLLFKYHMESEPGFQGYRNMNFHTKGGIENCIISPVNENKFTFTNRHIIIKA
jgi:hypothetical protein